MQLILPLLLAFLLAAPAFAEESICSGENVIWCDDFEDGSWTDDWGVSSYWDADTGLTPKGQAVKCSSYGFNSDCAIQSGDLLHFDSSWGYDKHFGGRAFTADWKDVYLRWYVKFSTGFQWGTVDDKGVYLRRTEGADADYIPNVKLEYSTYSSGKPNIACYNLSGERRYQNQENDITWETNKWYLVEMRIKLNDPGSANGIVQVWIDDASVPITLQTLRLSYTDLEIKRSTDAAATGYNTVFVTEYHQRCDARTRTHNGPDNSAYFVDSAGANLNDLSIIPGMTITNTSDGNSTCTLTTLANGNATLDRANCSGLSGGTEHDFDTGDAVTFACPATIDQRIVWDQFVLSDALIGPMESTDTTAPTTTISTSNSTITTSALTIEGTAEDDTAVSGCKWRLGSAPDATHGTACTGTTSFSCSTSGHSLGSNTAYVGCYDAAGNYGSDSITVTYNTPASGLGIGSGGSMSIGSGGSLVMP